MISEEVNGKSKLNLSHLIIPCSRIADHIQHLVCLRSPFYHENDVLIMQISFSGVAPNEADFAVLSKCIDKTHHN
jgi:hypothetical protein